MIMGNLFVIVNRAVKDKKKQAGEQMEHMCLNLKYGAKLARVVHSGQNRQMANS